MSNHKIALVPLATSYQQTPELFYKGVYSDTGLFAESLIYYDTIYVHAGNSEQFANFISILIQQGLTYGDLINLIKEGTLKFFNTVMVNPVVMRDVFTDKPRPDFIKELWTIEEEAIKHPNYFEKKFLDTDFLRNSFSDLSSLDHNAYEKFCEVSKENSLVFDNEVISSGIIDNAYEDFLNPNKHKLIVKSILREIYKINGLGNLPDFDVEIKEMNFDNLDDIDKNSTSTIVRGNVERNKIYEIDCKVPLKGVKDSEQLINVFRTLPLSIAGITDLYIRSAGKMKCDLFLPNPISQIVGNKLYEINDFEISARKFKIQNIIEKLQHQVSFPDLHSLVNKYKVNFDEVLKFRKRSKPLRDWLQDTNAEKDLEVFSAYHNEVAKENGYTKNIRRSLKIFGIVASGAVAGSATVATNYLSKDPSLSAFVGSATGIITSNITEKVLTKATEKLFDYGAHLGSDWKPICFGNWYKNEIENLLKNPSND